MNKTRYIILIAILAFGAVSCNWLDKESDTELTLEMVFNNKTRVEGWLGNVYSGIPDPYMGMGRYIGQDILGDDMSPSERWRQWNWDVIPFILGQWTPSSSWGGNYWAYLPQRIREAYIFIENAKALPDQNLPYEEVEYMKAECRFLAAYYWYLLTDTYGPVPYRPFFVAPADSDLASLKTPRTPYYEIIDSLDEEFLEVSKLLPATYSENRKYGRATSIMCLAIRARMLLFAAGDLVNGNPDYANFVDNQGNHLFSTSYDETRWTRAKDACKLLIDEAEKAGHKLYVEQDADGRDDPFLSVQNAILGRYDQGNKEILFARPGGCDYSDYEKHCTPIIGGGNGGWGVTQSLVDAFFMENGLPIDDPESGYVATGFSDSDDDRGYDWELECNGEHVTVAGTYKMYCNREPRFYVAVSFNNAWFASEERHFNFFMNGADNPHTHDAPQNGYLLRKKVSPDSDIKEGSFKYRPGIICRLAEAYLNYAEALNECGGNADEILDYVNRIRARAGVRKYTLGATDDEYIHVDADKESLRKIIRAERRVELCCEGLRYNDLRRWKEAETVLNGKFYGMNYNGTTAETFYQLTAYQTRVYKKSYYWFPIHQTELDKNENLVQNPYWGE
ncbi:MAG: RagB/SusD family nutrient uptake outer membrane protein [Candidatus Cryptobacteroides sp.]